jgi:phosphoribosylamine--glycine ligase
VFHAATRRNDDNYYVCGGRVLGVGACGVSVGDASRSSYDNISKLSAAGCRFRRDIGGVSESAMSAAVEVKRG